MDSTITPLTQVDPSSWDPHNLLGRYHLWKIKSKFPVPGSAVLNDARRRAFDSVVDAAEAETGVKRTALEKHIAARRTITESRERSSVLKTDQSLLYDKVEGVLDDCVENVVSSQLERQAPIARHNNLDRVFKLIDSREFGKLEDMISRGEVDAVGSQPKTYMTGLMRAVGAGLPALADWFLNNGAHVNAAGRTGQTALHFAWDSLLAVSPANQLKRAVARKVVKDLVTMLLEAGSDPNLAADNGVTPIHMAARFGHADLVVLMLQHGGRPDVRDKGGRTPSDLAKQFKRAEVAQLLSNWGTVVKGSKAHQFSREWRTALLASTQLNKDTLAGKIAPKEEPTRLTADEEPTKPGHDMLFNSEGHALDLVERLKNQEKIRQFSKPPRREDGAWIVDPFADVERGDHPAHSPERLSIHPGEASPTSPLSSPVTSPLRTALKSGGPRPTTSDSKVHFAASPSVVESPHPRLHTPSLLELNSDPSSFRELLHPVSGRHAVPAEHAAPGELDAIDVDDGRDAASEFALDSTVGWRTVSRGGMESRGAMLSRGGTGVAPPGTASGATREEELRALMQRRVDKQTVMKRKRYFDHKKKVHVVLQARDTLIRHQGVVNTRETLYKLHESGLVHTTAKDEGDGDVLKRKQLDEAKDLVRAQAERDVPLWLRKGATASKAAPSTTEHVVEAEAQADPVPAEAVKANSTLWNRRRNVGHIIARDAVAADPRSVIKLSTGEQYSLRPAGGSVVLRSSRWRTDNLPSATQRLTGGSKPGRPPTSTLLDVLGIKSELTTNTRPESRLKTADSAAKWSTKSVSSLQRLDTAASGDSAGNMSTGTADMFNGYGRQHRGDKVLEASTSKDDSASRIRRTGLHVVAKEVMLCQPTLLPPKLGTDAMGVVSRKTDVDERPPHVEVEVPLPPVLDHDSLVERKLNPSSEGMMGFGSTVVKRGRRAKLGKTGGEGGTEGEGEKAEAAGEAAKKGRAARQRKRGALFSVYGALEDPWSSVTFDPRRPTPAHEM